MAKHVSGKISQVTTTSGRGLNKRTIITTSETTDVPGVNINTTRVNRSVGEKLGAGLGVFGLIVGVLLSVSLIKSLMGGSSVTFGGLLEYLSNAPSINMSLTTFEVIAPLAWEGEILGSIAYFINIFITIFNVLIFAFKGLSQVVVYLVYFVRFLF